MPSIRRSQQGEFAPLGTYQIHAWSAIKRGRPVFREVRDNWQDRFQALFLPHHKHLAAGSFSRTRQKPQNTAIGEFQVGRVLYCSRIAMLLDTPRTYLVTSMEDVIFRFLHEGDPDFHGGDPDLHTCTERR